MIEILKKGYRSILSRFINSMIIRKDFCVFSNDCWGAEIYRLMGLEYNTPFVGLMLMAPCYIKLLENPRQYFSESLEFINESKYAEMNKTREKEGYYPLGKLRDIEIHFLHYKSEEEAIAKWNRRVSRINWDNLFIKFTLDKDYAEEIHLEKFGQLPYQRKICFSKREHPESEICLSVKNFSVNGKKLFKKCMKEFDVVGWINNGTIRLKGFSKLRGIFLYYFIR